MRNQIEQTLEIITRVRRRWSNKAPRDTVEQLRIDVVHEIAKERGITYQSVLDKPKRKFEPDIVSMGQFDSLLEQFLLSGSPTLRNLLLKHSKSDDEDQAIKMALPPNGDTVNDAKPKEFSFPNTSTPEVRAQTATKSEEPSLPNLSTPETGAQPVTISVQSKRTRRSVRFSKNLGSNLNEAVELFGEKTVFELFKAMAVVRCQGAVRLALNDPAVSENEAIQIGVGYDFAQPRRNRRAYDPISALADMVIAGKLTMPEVERMLKERLR